VPAAPVALIFFTAALVRGVFGFGDALVAMPLLSLLLELKIATPLFALVSLTAATAIALSSWRSLELRAVWRLLLGAAVGVPLGAWLLQAAPAETVLSGLGLFTAGFGLYRLLQPKLPARLRHPLWALPFGWVSGLLSGAYNTGGPPIVLYGSLQAWPPERFRATLQGYFWPVSVLTVASHGWNGLWMETVWQMYWLALPVVAIATLLGSFIHHRLSAQRFERWLFAMLVVLGLVLVV